ncbi:MAG TPA: adenylyl-sulfate kinase [Kofleriaceae bacterium]|jgi:adenylylsulfate kinase
MSEAGGAVVWFTGRPASGKTTLARSVLERLGPGVSGVLLDSDEVRAAIACDLGYGARDRTEFYRRLAGLAALLARQGAIVLVAATAPERRHRDTARALAPRFIEVHVDAPVEACAARDPKGLYARAAAGQAPDLPGVGADFEVPARPDVIASGGQDEAAVRELLVRLT